MVTTGFLFSMGLILVLGGVIVMRYDFAVGVLCLIVGLIMLGVGSERSEIEDAQKRVTDARSRIRNVFTQAGYESAEVDERAKLAEMLLREGTGDWTQFGPTQIASTIQAVDVLRNKKR